MVQQSSTGLYSPAPIFNLTDSAAINKIGANNDDDQVGMVWSGKWTILECG